MTNSTLNGLRRLNAKYEQAGEGMNDFVNREMNGEKPDSHEFMKLLEQRSIAKDAMQAQFKLFEKPMKTVLGETK